MSTAPVERAGIGGRLDAIWQAPIATKVFWALQIGVAFEFIGHGLAGLWRAPAWIPYFTFFGFSKEFAHDHLYYVTGTIDITIGVLTLFRPMRAVMLHMMVWGLFTAVLRPVTGESFFELVERGANYGMPAALLLLAGWGTWSLRSWFERVRPPASFTDTLAHQLEWVMRISIALLLIGHAGLGIWAHKPEWIKFFGWFGISSATVASQHLSLWVGIFEIALGLAVLIKPLRSVLVFILVWKVGTELLRPLVGQNNYQFIERAGDYILPLALIWVLQWRRAHRATDEAPTWVVPTPAVPARQFAWAGAVPSCRPEPVAVAAAVTSNGNGNPGGGRSREARPEPDAELVAAAAALTTRLAAERARR